MSKRRLLNIVVLTLIMALIFSYVVFFAACADKDGGDNEQNTEQGGEKPGENPDDDIIVTSVILNKTSLTLEVGESQTLTATVLPSNATDKSVTWSSSNTAVATVSGGRITAVAAGTATITVTTGNGKTATCTVTVNEPATEIIEVTSISLSQTSLYLEIGESYTLVAMVLPDNATDKSVTWSSSEPSVATVGGGRITAVAAGTATITVTTGNGKKATCNVTVNEPAPGIVEVTSVSLNQTSLTLEVGENYTLTATVLPANATDKSVTWSSSELSVATVKNGKVTAIGAGAATITATSSNGKTATCTVTVTNPYADFSFAPSGNGYMVTGYSGANEVVSVPAEYDGKPVTIIGERAFYDCASITKIALPDTIKEIGASAFGYCTSLQTVEIPASTRIGDNAFIGCTSLQEITLPEGLISIGDSLFTYCNSLQKVTILSGNISANVFAGCSSLKEIVLDEGVASVARGAFEDCTSLKYLTMPRVEENVSFNEYYFNIKNSTYTLSGTGAGNLYPAEVRSYTVNIGGVNRVFGIPVTGTDWYYNYDTVTQNGVTYQYSGKPVTVTSWESMYEATVGVSWRRPESWEAEVYIANDSSLEKLTVTDQLISIYDEVFDGCGCEIDILQKYPVESISVIGEAELYLDEFLLDDYVLRVRHTDGWIEDLPLAEQLSEAEKQQLQQSGMHTFTISYGGQSCEFSIALNLHTFDQAVMEDLVVVADSSVKSLEVTGIPEGTEIVWENNGQSEVGEYTVTATLKNPYYEDKTLTAHLYIRQAQYNITYVLGVEEAENSNPATYNFGEGLTLSSPASAMWEFLGWYFDEEFTTQVTSISVDDYGDKTFYAKWQSIFIYNNATITGLTDYGKANCTVLDIPTEINGTAITGIGNSAFSGCASLTSVTIPASVTSIGSNAFYNCSNLEGVYITDIAAWCKIEFDGWSANPLSYANNLYLNGGLVTDLVIPEGVTSIGDNTFYNCSSLTSVTIPASVTSIGDNAFYNCRGLASITIPASVTSIGSNAFNNCSNLEGVYITNIAAWCKIEFGGSTANPLYYAGNLYLNGELVTDLVIPEGVTSISSYAFYGCSSLTSVTIPTSVTSIGSAAFGGCISLESMTLPFVGGSASATTASSSTLFGYIFGTSRYTGGVSTLQHYASGSYTTYYIPATLKSVTITGGNICYGAFDNCSGLTSITIPASVTSIGSSAFSSCRGLETVTFDGDSQLTSIGENAFYGCSGLTSITIPASVTSIGSSAFYGCNRLIIYCEVTSQPSGWSSTWNDSGCPVVWGCNNNQVASDGNIYAIIGGLRYSLNNGIATVARQPSNLSGEIVILSTVNYNGTTYSVTNIGDSAFSGCSSLTSITIPASVTSIGNYAFSGCSSLTSITIPASVTSIGDYAFYNCRSLETVTFDEDSQLTSIGNSAFYNCTSLTSVNIPDSVTSIGNYVFYNCRSLTSITIPASVTSIGSVAFSGRSSLTIYCEAVSQPSGWNSSWNYSNCPVVWDCNNNQVASDGNIYAVIDGLRYSLNNGNALIVSQPSNLTGEIVIPSTVNYNGTTYTVTSIDRSAFYGCSGLTCITIPASVTSIGYSAFTNCSSLTIYCEVESQPSGWSSSWNSSNCPVVWGYRGVEATYHFVSNGGSEIADITSSAAITLPTPELEGYIFGGWYLSEDLSGTAVSSPYYNSNGATLYAKWIDLDGLEQRAGLEIENGYIVGIGTCTDTELILNMPIAEGAFIWCDSITKVTFGEGVTSIGYQAFGNSGTGCDNLTEVIFLSVTPPEIGSDVFGSTWNHSAGFTVYVPKGSLAAYEAVSDRYWQQYLVDAGKIKEV